MSLLLSFPGPILRLLRLATLNLLVGIPRRETELGESFLLGVAWSARRLTCCLHQLIHCHELGHVASVAGLEEGDGRVLPLLQLRCSDDRCVLGEVSDPEVSIGLKNISVPGQCAQLIWQLRCFDCLVRYEQFHIL